MIIFVIVLLVANILGITIINSANSKPVLHYDFSEPPVVRNNFLVVVDESDKSKAGNVYNAKWDPLDVNNTGAMYFNGINSFIQTPDKKELSPSTTDELTIAFWIKFSDTSFVGEGSHKDYIHFIGKGEYDQGYEYMFRQYNSSNKEDRGNRISFYIFNPKGGLGAGASFQEPINTSEWMFITGVIKKDEIQIWKNGILKDTGYLRDYNITPERSSSPFNIGTGNGNSYFNGSIKELRVYQKALSKRKIKSLYENI